MFQTIRFISIGVLTHLAFISTRFTTSLYAIDKDASTFTIGTILSLFSLIPMLISVRIGRWVDQSGPFSPTITGIALLIVGALFPLMFSYETADLAPLLVSATLVGTGFTLSILSMQQHLGESSKPEDRSTIFSWFAMGVSVSGFVGPILSGIIIDAVSHRPTFLIPIISSIVALTFLCFGQKPKHKNNPPSELKKGKNPFQLLRFTDLRDVLIVTGIISMCWDLQNFVIPIHGAQIGFSASKIGGIFGAFAVATFAIRIFMPTVRKFTTEWQVLLGTLGCVSCCFFLFPFVKSYATFLGIALILGLGLGAAQPNIMTLVHTTAPHNRVAEALGLRLTVIHGNQVLLPIIFGAFGTALGTSAIFWTVTFIALAGVIFILRKEKHRR